MSESVQYIFKMIWICLLAYITSIHHLSAVKSRVINIYSDLTHKSVMKGKERFHIITHPVPVI